MDGDIVGLTNRTIDRLSGQLTNWSSGRLTDYFDYDAFALIDDVIVGCIQALSRI